MKELRDTERGMDEDAAPCNGTAGVLCNERIRQILPFFLYRVVGSGYKSIHS